MNKIPSEKTLQKISKEELYFKYATQQKSFRDIRKEYGFEHRTIKKLLQYYGIEIRYGAEAIKAQWNGNKGEQRREKSFENRKNKTPAKGGYIRIKDKDRYRILEHRAVMEKYLGRKLTKDEIVHHIDGNKKNNDITNLKLMSNAEHSKLHYQEKNIDENGRILKDMLEEDTKKKNPFKEIVNE